MQVRCKSTKIKTPCISTLRKLYLQVRISPSPPNKAVKNCTRKVLKTLVCQWVSTLFVSFIFSLFSVKKTYFSNKMQVKMQVKTSNKKRSAEWNFSHSALLYI